MDEFTRFKLSVNATSNVISFEEKKKIQFAVEASTLSRALMEESKDVVEAALWVIREKKLAELGSQVVELYKKQPRQVKLQNILGVCVTLQLQEVIPILRDEIFDENARYDEEWQLKVGTLGQLHSTKSLEALKELLPFIYLHFTNMASVVIRAIGSHKKRIELYDVLCEYTLATGGVRIPAILALAGINTKESIAKLLAIAENGDIFEKEALAGVMLQSLDEASILQVIRFAVEHYEDNTGSLDKLDRIARKALHECAQRERILHVFREYIGESGQSLTFGALELFNSLGGSISLEHAELAFAYEANRFSETPHKEEFYLYAVRNYLQCLKTISDPRAGSVIYRYFNQEPDMAIEALQNQPNTEEKTHQLLLCLRGDNKLSLKAATALEYFFRTSVGLDVLLQEIAHAERSYCFQRGTAEALIEYLSLHKGHQIEEFLIDRLTSAYSSIVSAAITVLAKRISQNPTFKACLEKCLVAEDDNLVSVAIGAYEIYYPEDAAHVFMGVLRRKAVPRRYRIVDRLKALFSKGEVWVSPLLVECLIQGYDKYQISTLFEKSAEARTKLRIDMGLNS